MSSPEDRTTESPIACRRDAFTPEQRRRRDELWTHLEARLVRREPTSDGVELGWDDADLLPLVAELVSLERICCPFVRFHIDVEAEGGPVTLGLGGRDGVQPFLLATFGGA